MSTQRCFYFGCWNTAGHYLFAPGGRSVGAESRLIEHYAGGRHIDATLAPRVGSDNKITWTGAHPKDKRTRVESSTEECPQGQFLLHHLDNGFTAIQWWDRCQGDTRGACNSTVLLEGVHTAEEMLAALREHFPHVVENLKRGGPLPPKRPPNEFWRPPEKQASVELVDVSRKG